MNFSRLFIQITLHINRNRNIDSIGHRYKHKTVRAYCLFASLMAGNILNVMCVRQHHCYARISLSEWINIQCNESRVQNESFLVTDLPHHLAVRARYQISGLIAKNYSTFQFYRYNVFARLDLFRNGISDVIRRSIGSLVEVELIK